MKFFYLWFYLNSTKYKEEEVYTLDFFEMKLSNSSFFAHFSLCLKFQLSTKQQQIAS
jgi:hypothetical protein